MITKPIDGIDATGLWTASAWVVASLLNEVERLEGVEAVYKGKVYDQAKEIERLKQVLTNSVTQAERQIRLKDEALADRDKKIEKLERDIRIKDAVRADIQSLLGSYKKSEQSAWDQLQLARNKVVEQDATIKGLKACNNFMPVEGWHRDLATEWKTEVVKTTELTKKVEELEKKLTEYKSLNGLYVHNGTGWHIRAFVA